MISSPWPIALLLVCYHRFVRKWGPEFMKNRPAYDLKKVIIVYNVIQIWASAHLLIKCLTLVYLPGYYTIGCQKIITDDTPVERQIVFTVWSYYIIKIVDLLDTFMRDPVAHSPSISPHNFHQSTHYPSTFHQPISNSIRYPIPTQDAGKVLVQKESLWGYEHPAAVATTFW
ncbi:Elongation of very long chain fatty acids protein 7 [Eumeta japonica]|uniref:Elongation of very long chain fatty acids protein n=1 Tax=Eumeta variegata TaxID=151549 RepID=A0A4C1Y685_EUMVA|nr:Elongation of very long chain fatty acids protein 7 [Eumeta japonica]